MNIKMKGPRGMTITAENADDSLQEYFREKIRQAWAKELANFIEEVSVALRKMQPGDTLALYSKPIEVKLEKTHDPIEQPA